MKRLISKVKQVLFGAVVRTRARTVGKGLKVNRYSWVSKSVVLGDNVNFNGMRIVGEGEIRIGSNFHSGRGCSIIGSFHDFDYGDAVPYGMAKIDKDVVIEDNVWLGDQVIVLGGLISERALLYRLGVSSSIMFQRVLLPEVILSKMFKMRDMDHYEALKAQGRFFWFFEQRAGKKGWIASDNEVNSWRYHAGVMLR